MIHGNGSTMEQPRLLDLFCGAGGAGEGYRRAGFDVTGVDNRPMPNNPHTFIQADALEYVAKHGHEYDAIHASPPCQRYSEATPVELRETMPDMIEPTRKLLQSTGNPYVIENVENARRHLINPLMLCGTMFGLPIWRHRYFELYPLWCLSPASCRHHGRPISIHPGSNARKDRGGPSVIESKKALDIEWMNLHELYQAIPPVYTEFIGRQLLAYVTQGQMIRANGSP